MAVGHWHSRAGSIVGGWARLWARAVAPRLARPLQATPAWAAAVKRPGQGAAHLWRPDTLLLLQAQEVFPAAAALRGGRGVAVSSGLTEMCAWQAGVSRMSTAHPHLLAVLVGQLGGNERPPLGPILLHQLLQQIVLLQAGQGPGREGGG